MIDDHAHPFPLEFAPLELASISLDTRSDPAAPSRRLRTGPGRLFEELLTGALADLLGCDFEEPRDVVAMRDAHAEKDWSAWVRRLFDDAGISGMLLDEGVSSAHGGPLGAYTALTGRPFWRLARVDPLVDELISANVTASEIVRAVEDFMSAAVASGAVGFKTIIAYRTGLAVDPNVSLQEAAASLSVEHGAVGPIGRRAKALRDLVTRTLLARAAELKKPVQIHTGFGDSDIRLADADPLLLEPLLDSPAGSAATVVLIHGSYPWHEQVGYLATVRPNVYVELSLSNLFAPLGVARRLSVLMDLTPRDKLLMGSDGHGAPETHWFACRMLSMAFEKLSVELAAAGARSSWVEASRRAVFEENAREVYSLS
jgi:predicted TIM-barrel fold metal-dependent hydrolase